MASRTMRSVIILALMLMAWGVSTGVQAACGTAAGALSSTPVLTLTGTDGVDTILTFEDCEIPLVMGASAKIEFSTINSTGIGICCFAGGGLNINQISPSPGVNHEFVISMNGNLLGGTQPFGFSMPIGFQTGKLVFSILYGQLPPPPPPPSVDNFDHSGIVGDPISTHTGELFNQYVPDISLGGPFPLNFSRYYASRLLMSGVTGALANNWRHNFEWKLAINGSDATITSNRGREISFVFNGTSWDLTGTLNIPFQFVSSGIDFDLYHPGTGLLYTFNSAGTLLSIEDRNGNTHTLTYSGSNLASVTDGLGRMLAFSYTGNLLDAVTDGTRTVNFVRTGSDLTSVTDVVGNMTTFAYATGSLMTSSTLPKGNTPFTQNWNAESKVTTQTNSDGNTTTLSIISSSTNITDALNRSQLHVHSSAGELSSSRDSANKTVVIGYDVTGRRSSITDRLGDMTSMGYHTPSGKLASKTNADGSTSSLSYTAKVSGGVTRYDLTGITHADGTAESFAHDANGNPSSHIDRASNSSSATYDSNGQPLTTTNSASGVSTFTYNANGTVATHGDPAGNTTTFGYDAFGLLNQLTFADTSSQLTTFDAKDRPLTAIDENGNTTTMTYDANGNLATMTDSLNNTTSFAYDGNDHLLRTTDSLGGTVNTTYDALGRPSTSTDENNNTTINGYDTLGRVSTITYPLGNSNSFTYDAEGVITSASDGLGNTTIYTTDPMGRTTQVSSPLGNTNQTGYDVMGRTISTTDPLSQITLYTHDNLGLLTSITLPDGASTSYTRNGLSNITQITDPGGNRWQSSYNNQGLRTSHTDPLSNVRTITYNNRNRPFTITYADGVIQTMGYDLAGNLTSRSYSSGDPAYNYNYDNNNRLTSANEIALGYDTNNNISSTNGITLTRDAGGRITSMTLATGKTITYGYDANDNLTSVTDWISGITSFGYDAADRLIGITRPVTNGVNTIYGYDNDNRLIGIIDGNFSSILLARDANGQVTAVARTAPQTSSAMGSPGLTYSVDTASQIASTGYVYDARGRLTSDGTKNYTWDAASRLTNLIDGGVTTTYTYDAMGRRLSRTTNGITRNYIWNDALSLPSVSIETQNGTDFRYFIHTPAGALLYSIDAVSNARRFYHYDERSNTIAITDDSGAIVGSYAYTPYGKLTSSSGALDNPFTWQGKDGVMDEGNGLYYMRARYYDSKTARFVSRDLIKSINPREVNPYQYASGNPMKFSDPLGLEDLDGFDDAFNNAENELVKLGASTVAGIFPWSPFNASEARFKTTDEVAMDAVKKGLGSVEKRIIKSAANKGVKKIPVVGAVIAVGEFSGKLLIINYNLGSDVDMAVGKAKVRLFQQKRDWNTQREVRKAWAKKDVNSLSAMNPLARDALRNKALVELYKVQLKLASTRATLEKSRYDYDKDILGPQIKLLERRLPFLENAVAGELVPGENGYDGLEGIEPPSKREAVVKFGK